MIAALNADYEDWRMPLHLNPELSLERQDPQLPHSPPIDMGDPLEFNGIGSRRSNRLSHFPVIAVAGLASIDRHGKKAIIHSFGLPENDHRPGYMPSSDLRDVLGDHKIELEVFEEPIIEGGTRGSAVRYGGKRVTDIVLRSEKQNGIFESFGAADEAQLYIQTPFESSDHATLIAGLGSIGIITPRWEELVTQAGMGIVWAPWHTAQTHSLQA